MVFSSVICRAHILWVVIFSKACIFLNSFSKVYILPVTFLLSLSVNISKTFILSIKIVLFSLVIICKVCVFSVVALYLLRLVYFEQQVFLRFACYESLFSSLVNVNISKAFISKNCFIFLSNYLYSLYIINSSLF